MRLQRARAEINLQSSVAFALRHLTSFEISGPHVSAGVVSTVLEIHNLLY